jgi:hypothetical protein
MSVLIITTRTDRQASGVAGATRRGSHAGKHGRPFGMSGTTTGRYKETKFSLVLKGVGVAHSTVGILKTT